MTRFHIGAKALRSDIAAYAKRFDLLEVTPAAAGPTLATLRRWRKSVPPHFEFAVVAGPHVGLLKPGAALEQELAAAREAAIVLEARCIVVPTPAEVTPAAVWRDRMSKLVKRLPRDVTNIVWEPRGVWEIGDAAVAARTWGVVLAVDPARDPVPQGPTAYARLRHLGETRSYGAAALERVVRAIGQRRDAYVILETPTALKECKRLRQLAQGSRAARSEARLVRPRAASVRVRDDEQE
jgi:uncharacterized protein YecE (DUF72 family)